MKYTLLFFLFFSHFICKGQFVADLFQVDEYIKRNDKNMEYSLPKNYKGTPYYNDNFLQGKIYRNDTIVSKDIAIRYNIYSNEIEVKESVDQHDSLAKPLTKSPAIAVSIEEDYFFFLPYNDKIEEGSYFQRIFRGKKVSLIKTTEKEFATPKTGSSSITRDIKGAFIDRNTFFLMDPNGKLYELPKKRKKKLLVFGSKKGEVENFVRKFKLNLNNEEELIKVVNYFDNL